MHVSRVSTMTASFILLCVIKLYSRSNIITELQQPHIEREVRTNERTHIIAIIIIIIIENWHNNIYARMFCLGVIVNKDRTHSQHGIYARGCFYSTPNYYTLTKHILFWQIKSTYMVYPSLGYMTQNPVYTMLV